MPDRSLEGPETLLDESSGHASVRQGSEPTCSVTEIKEDEQLKPGTAAAVTEGHSRIDDAKTDSPDTAAEPKKPE